MRQILILLMTIKLQTPTRPENWFSAFQKIASVVSTAWHDVRLQAIDLNDLRRDT